MRKSILQFDNQKTHKDEYLKMIQVLGNKCIVFQKKEYTYFQFINEHLFNNWKFRGTYIDLYEYLESIGINIKNKKISKESFINFLEFLSNMVHLTNSLKYYSDQVKYSVQCKSILVHNIPILLDHYGYEAYSLDDRILILEKDLMYDDLTGILPNSIEECFLSYKDIKNSGIKMKRLILYKIFEYMNQDKYKSIQPSIFNQIKMIVLKLGVMGEIDKKYSELSNYKLRKYYDICFQMMVYLVKTENILKYKEQIKTEL